MAQSNFGSYTDRLLELCNETFSTLYYNVLKRYWHDNKFMAKMPRNYAFTNWRKGIYEVYIPTRDEPACNLQYYRVAVKILPELDRDISKTESAAMRKLQIRPNGVLDSELIVLMAEKRSEKAKKERQFLRGFKHVKKPGYLTAQIITNIPEIAFKRMLTLISKFIEKRIDKLLEKMDFQPWQYDFKEKQQFYYSYLFSLIERFSHLIATTLRSFSHVLYWVNGKIKAVKREIGRQSMLKMAIHKIRELKPLLKDLGLAKSELLCDLEKALNTIPMKSDSFRKTRMKH